MHHSGGVVAVHVVAEDHIVSIERFAIAPLDAIAQFDRDFGEIGIVLPAFRQPVLVVAGEYVEHDQWFK